MANIRVDLDYTINDGSSVVFRSPCDCTEITGLIVYYIGADGKQTSKEFALADAHGENVGDIPHLFTENVVVKVILDVTSGMAFVQNADTNAYLEGRFAKKVSKCISVKETGTDLNDYVTDGMWYFANVFNSSGFIMPTNHPSGAQGGWLQVVSGEYAGSRVVKQIWYNEMFDDHQTFVRTYNFEGWSNWMRYITETELHSAINTALAQAKESGEFKGDPGKTPVKFVDYFTEADKEEIVQQVITALGTPVFGRVDADNNIILTGELADGTYTLKYEDADGNVAEIGTINLVAEPEPAYTNLADPDDTNWVLGKRYNSSNVLTDAAGCVISNYIDVSGCTSHIAIKGIDMKSGNGRIYFYNAVADTPVSYLNTTTSGSVTTADYDESVYIIPASLIASTTLWRFGGSLVSTSDDVIIAIDEDIK